jgi:hypothetical protein
MGMRYGTANPVPCPKQIAAPLPDQPVALLSPEQIAVLSPKKLAAPVPSTHEVSSSQQENR